MSPVACCGGFPLPRAPYRWLDLANTQGTLDGWAAEVEVTARVRSGWRPQSAAAWDDLADDLEPLASFDWNPRRSIEAYSRVHKLGCDVRKKGRAAK